MLNAGSSVSHDKRLGDGCERGDKHRWRLIGGANGGMMHLATGPANTLHTPPPIPFLATKSKARAIVRGS